MNDTQRMDNAQVTAVLDFWFGPLDMWDRGPEASMERHQFWWQGGAKVRYCYAERKTTLY
jgi:hypothetical protein